MIKATTSHGTYYLIDEKNRKAVRVPSENKQDIYKNVESWFNFYNWSGAEVGKAMIFYIEKTIHNHFDFQRSTPVASIEEIEDE